MLLAERDEQALFNGDFLVWNRATSFSWSNGTGGLTADGWYGGPGTSGSATITRTALPIDVASVVGARYAHKIQITGVASVGEDQTSTGWFALLEHGAHTGDFIDPEGVRRWAGKRVSVEWWVESTGGEIQPIMWQSFGTGGGESTFAGVITDPLVPSVYIAAGSWQRIISTFMLPHTADKTLGANQNDYLGWGIRIRAGQGPTLSIAGVRVLRVE